MINSQYKCPTGLLGLSVFYWSWSLEIWPLGLLMAVGLEVYRWIPWRLHLREKDFMRIADLTAVTFAITGVTLLATNLYESLFILAEWLPLIIYLLLIAQLYSEVQITPLKAIIASLRRQSPTSPAEDITTIDLRLPFFFLTLIAISIAAAKSQAFYIILCVLLVWALWPLRSPGYKSASWILMIGSAFSLGFALLTGISQLQGMVQEFTTQWFQADWSQRNMKRNTTAMGQIGRLKLSEQIFMRIQSKYAKETLLQQASYNRFSGITWHTSEKQFKQVGNLPETHRYLLSSAIPENGGELEISTYLEDGEGILALPLGSYAIDKKRNAKLFINDFGSARIQQDNTLLNFKVHYRADAENMLKPTDYDLEVPNSYQKLLGNIVEQLKLKKLPANKAADELQQYFQNNFQYTLIQDSTSLVLNPLSTFLTDIKKGHCEYFATAGALILRAAGIPSRYATGYLMTELDPDSNQFIVRSRHAHAWTLAYINDQWIELDFTPATWSELESQAAPWWQNIYDISSNSLHFFYTWWNARPRSPHYYALLIVLLLVAFIVGKKFKPQQFRFHLHKQHSEKNQQQFSNTESPFNKVIEHLEQNLLVRNNGETVKQWVRRIPDLNAKHRSELDELVQLHYLYRFAPEKSDYFCSGEFARDVERWLEEFTQTTGKPIA